ncbi:hypothetical protein [Halorubrum vacuolatum]|uniref:DUF8049 domain-containing protein n=1 Tax=Halorubrum vacuolatum TaxID=63740 RepID=A0A238UR87_HALVU|nr:hypothetical protein [Halorubrum vacuolatum]SNR23839.1 hypothetical protein SAMN06264855_101178 [Halorubrum vacuolatum]
MKIERAREDLVVAGSGAGATVVLAILSSVGLVGEISSIAMLAPVFVYFAYLFSRKGGPYGSWDLARNWAILAILVALGVLVGSLV